MNIRINQQNLKGKMNSVSSKPIAQRAILLSFIKNGITKLKNVNLCDDVKNTLNIIRLITDVEINDNEVIIKGLNKEFDNTYFQIDESLSTFNFLLPVLGYFSKNPIEIEVKDGLFNRIGTEFEDIYTNTECKFVKENNKVYIKGFPIKKEYIIDNRKTSQIVSGLLFLLVKLNQDTKIVINSYNSISYIDQTINILNIFGYDVKREKYNIFVMHNQINKINEYTIPCDGTYYLMQIALKSMFENIEIDNNVYSEIDSDYNLGLKIIKNNYIIDDEIDLSNNPDAICALSFLALNKNTPTKFYNIERLKKKESNRILTTSLVLNSFGIKTEFNDDSLTIYPSSGKKGITNTYKDHRIAQLATLLCLKYGGEIENFEYISKSSPNFLNDLSDLGLFFEDLPVQLEESLQGKIGKIIIKDNLINDLNKYKENKKYILISEKNIPSEYIEKVKNNYNISYVYIIDKEKENIKTFEVVNNIISFLLEKNISKSDCLIALGGGTITDLVTYCASVYKRGIETILIPTTVISQVDASIGFKCGINVGEFKNVVGTYYVPIYIFIDPLLVNSMKIEEYNNSLSELIKIFSLKSLKYFYKMYDKQYAYKELLEEAIKIKLEIINKDPYDENERHILNFGHTYGHVLELKENISHGEAVAYGMRMCSNSKELNECLDIFGFVNKYNKEELEKYILNDKKIYNNKLSLIRLKEIGKPIIKEKTI